MAELTLTVGRLMRWVQAICTDANSVGDMIAEIAPEAGEPKETLLLAAKAHELLVLAVGPLLWSRCSRSPRAMLTYDPWVLGFVFLLGVIVGHYFSTVCPY
jgi:hypothetical protein